MGRLSGKVAFITGGGSGIGRASAIRMTEAGASVAVVDNRADAAEEVAGELAAKGFAARAWELDVSREADVSRVINEAAAHFGRLDIVLNNAGVSGANKPTDEVTEEEWDFVQAVNVKGVFFCTKHAIPHLRRAGGGSIVNISSIYGIVGAPDSPPYHASKGAVRLMTKTDAMLYAPDRIRVNSVHPGFIHTPMVDRHLERRNDVEARLQVIDSLHPLGHMGEPDDIAFACLYLATDEAKFVTGAELVVDGGYTAR